jgi:predicted nucleic acid-binding protein
MATSKLTATTLDFAAPLPVAIYWDASFIVNFSHTAGKFYTDCAAFAIRLKESNTLSYVSALALDEAWFALMQVFVARDYAPRKFWKVYEENPQVILRYLDSLEAFTRDLYSQPQVRMIGVGRRSPLDALKNMRQYFFLPRDAMHLAIMRQHRITDVVTTDVDFQFVEGLTVFTCNPLLLAHSSTD